MARRARQKSLALSGHLSLGEFEADTGSTISMDSVWLLVARSGTAHPGAFSTCRAPTEEAATERCGDTRQALGVVACSYVGAGWSLRYWKASAPARGQRYEKRKL